VTYRTLADVREQLRRRFEPSGAPVWVAGERRVDPLARDLASADLQLRPYEFRILQVVVGLAFALIAFLRFNISFAVPVAAVIGYVLPAFYLRNRRGHRLRMFDDALPRAMELIANSIKAGQSIVQSLAAVTENAGPPVSEEFGLAQREIELGASVESALANMEKRMGSSDLRLMIMVISIQHAVGGDLPAILTTLADTMRQRREMREEVLAATAQSRASSLIITALPIVVATFGYFVLPDYFRPLFTNVIGWLIIFMAAVLLGTGTVIIRRMTAIS
jgi:tight adherence protein B